MKVRVKKGKMGFFGGSIRRGENKDKPSGDVFTITPLNHSTEVDDKGEPVVITVDQQFSPIWMDKVAAKRGPKSKEEKNED